MQQDLSEVLARLQARFVQSPHAPELRAGLQDYFDAALCTPRTDGRLTAEQAAAVAEGLALLRQICNAQPPKAEDPIFRVSLSELCENLAFACDLLCAPADRRLFYCGEAEVDAACRPHAVLWALLNLLANAISYTRGKYIFLCAAKRPNGTVLRVSAEGIFPFSRFETQLTRRGGGLWYAAQTAALHGGTLLLSHADGYSPVTLALPHIETAASTWETPDFTDWLADRLSPVYTALSGIPMP